MGREHQGRNIFLVGNLQQFISPHTHDIKDGNVVRIGFKQVFSLLKGGCLVDFAHIQYLHQELQDILFVIHDQNPFSF